MLISEALQADPQELERSLERHIVEQTWSRIRDLEVHVAGCRVIVHGHSPSYYLKQRALQAIRDLVELLPVELDIDVATALARPVDNPRHGWIAPARPPRQW